MQPPYNYKALAKVIASIQPGNGSLSLIILN